VGRIAFMTASATSLLPAANPTVVKEATSAAALRNLTSEI
jgi:hypothetical protein